MTTSEQISLHDAFEEVSMSRGAAALLLQFMAQQLGHDTEAGAALRDGGITVGTPPPVDPPVSRASSSRPIGSAV